MTGSRTLAKRIASIAIVAGLGISELLTAPAAQAAKTGIDLPPRPRFHPARTVTTTLVNHTGCTLVGSRGWWPVWGNLVVAPPLQIAPGATGTWQSSGYWLGDPSTATTLTYDLTGCRYTGEVGYSVGNVDPEGVGWGQYSCDTHPIRGLESVMSGTNGMDATVSIHLRPVLIIIKPPPVFPRPSLGACGPFPTNDPA